MLIHAGDVVAHVPEDLDVERCIESAGDRMRSVGIHDAHLGHSLQGRALVQEGVQVSQTIASKIELP
jgi:hypothetical protein